MIRQATLNDLDVIWQLRLETTQLLKERGIDQWQFQNPTKQTFENDIRLGEFYVYVDHKEIMGMMALKGGIEKSGKTPEG